MALSLPGNTSQNLDAVIAAAAENPQTVGVFSDFDGTLSNLIDDPQAVVPVGGAVEVVSQLAEVCGRVAIVSGRPVSFLAQFFDPPVELSGLYGIEHRSDSAIAVDPTATEWLPVLSNLAAEGTERFGAGVVEDKTYSLTLHYRNVSQKVGDEVVSWSESKAAEHGLHARSAKMSVELHPPVDRDKGDAIESMFHGLTAAVYLGDDVGDRSAFERIGEAVDNGQLQAGAAVLINGVETPGELLEVVTDELSTPDQAVELLAKLLGSAT